MDAACLDDDALAALHGGRHAPPAAVLVHLAACADCRTLVAAIGVELPASAAPATIGRYVLGEVIGAGAMGVVYRAHDPELGRDVALKVLRPVADLRLREAQAMARVEHPNVVRVYDAGHHAGEVYLAMELVDGTTLATWLAAAPRDRDARVAGLAAIGRGLAAIHAVGLVHRDVKPANVLVSRRGTWKVSDLGLAGEGNADGAVVGTPAYMAPEQRRGEPIDARADQYALARVMVEVLGDVSTPALRAVIARAGSAAPAARFASMDALVDALLAAHARPRRRRRLAIATLVAGSVVASTALVTTSLRAAPTPRCGDGAALVAARWPGRAALPAWPDDEAARLAGVLDGYGTAWTDARTTACRATEIEHTQPAPVMAARMHCLSERLAEVGGVVAVATAAHDVATRARATTAAVGLTPLATCADVVAIDTRAPEPTAAAAQRTLGVLRDALGDAKARLRAGDAAAVATALTPHLADAAALDYAPTLADVELQLGTAHEILGDLDAAEPLLRAAAQHAARGRDDQLQATAWLAVGYLVGFRRQQPADGRRWLEAAEAAIARAGSPPRLQAQLALYRGTMAMVDGDVRGAVTLYREALGRAVDALPPGDLRLAAYCTNLGIAEQSAGAYDDAAATLRRGLTLREAALGATHPDLASSLLALGQLEVVRGHADLAVPLLARALTIRRQVWGDDHPDVAAAWTSLGSAERQRGDLAAARHAHQEAIRIWTAALGPAHPTLAPALTNLGTVELQAGHAAAAEALFRRVLAIHQARGKPHPALATAWLNLGEARRVQGACAEAVPAYEEALAIRTQVLGADHVELALPLVGLGECALANARRAAARGYFEQALALTERGDAAAVERATARFGLARATANVTLADAAYAECDDVALRTEIDAWRKGRR